MLWEREGLEQAVPGWRKVKGVGLKGLEGGHQLHLGRKQSGNKGVGWMGWGVAFPFEQGEPVERNSGSRDQGMNGVQRNPPHKVIEMTCRYGGSNY